MCPSSSRTFIINICWTLSNTFLPLLGWSIIYVFKSYWWDMLCLWICVYCTNLASFVMYSFLYFISLNLVTEYAFEDFFLSLSVSKKTTCHFLVRSSGFGVRAILYSQNAFYNIHHLPVLCNSLRSFEVLISDPPWKYACMVEFSHEAIWSWAFLCRKTYCFNPLPFHSSVSGVCIDRLYFQ